MIKKGFFLITRQVLVVVSAIAFCLPLSNCGTRGGFYMEWDDTTRDDSFDVSKSQDTVNYQGFSDGCLMASVDADVLGRCLVQASRSGDVSTIRELLDACVDGIIPDQYWETAWDEANKNGHTEITGLLDNYQPECLNNVQN